MTTYFMVLIYRMCGLLDNKVNALVTQHHLAIKLIAIILWSFVLFLPL